MVYVYRTCTQCIVEVQMLQCDSTQLNNAAWTRTNDEGLITSKREHVVSLARRAERKSHREQTDGVFSC